jgi:hypothetical protein
MTDRLVTLFVGTTLVTCSIALVLILLGPA